MGNAVSVVIVNWNGERHLWRCFQALGAQTFRDFEVIFVDNASADGSVPLARELASGLEFRVEIIELPVNTGFTGGNIEGLRHAGGKYIALLNSDTEASAGWLGALVTAMESHPEAGICASKLVVAGTDIIDSAGDIVVTSLKAFKRGEGMPAHLFNTEEYVFGACAGAALYRREMLDEIGFFDPGFFVIFEDSDLSFRAQLGGWKCLFVPEAVVLHDVGVALRKLGALSTVHAVRNDKAVMVKNAPLSVILRHLPCVLFGEAVSLAYHLRTGRFGAYLRGNIEFFRRLPAYLGARRGIMERKKVSSAYINGMLSSLLLLYVRKLSARWKALMTGGYP